MHVFLTGAIRTGKSSIIKLFLEQSGLTSGGFRTCWQPDGSGGEDLLLMPFAASQPTGLDNRAAHRSPDGLTVNPAVFDRLAPLILAESAQYPLLIMDELGFMESRAPGFQAAVLRCLDSKTPVLGVIRDRPTAFLDSIRRRADVLILTVFPDNHDEVLARLTAWSREVFTNE